jgi:hypothetical protein
VKYCILTFVLNSTRRPGSDQMYASNILLLPSLSSKRCPLKSLGDATYDMLSKSKDKAKLPR